MPFSTNDDTLLGCRFNWNDTGSTFFLFFLLLLLFFLHALLSCSLLFNLLLIWRRIGLKNACVWHNSLRSQLLQKSATVRLCPALYRLFSRNRRDLKSLTELQQSFSKIANFTTTMSGLLYPCSVFNLSGKNLILVGLLNETAEQAMVRYGDRVFVGQYSSIIEHMLQKGSLSTELSSECHVSSSIHHSCVKLKTPSDLRSIRMVLSLRKVLTF